MRVPRIMNPEDIFCINEEFYIFLTRAKEQITINIWSKEAFKIRLGTREELEEAAKVKGGSGLGCVMFGRKNRAETFILDKETKVVRYILTTKNNHQIQIGINAPESLKVLRRCEETERLVQEQGLCVLT